MAACLLPDVVLEALGRWWDGNAVRLADGTPGVHAVRYRPSRWARIAPWPSGLASVTEVGDADVSRAQVALIVADALRREAYGEALVASYVWGKGFWLTFRDGCTVGDVRWETSGTEGGSQVQTMGQPRRIECCAARRNSAT
ncbi:hypothetical protein ACFQ8C_36980 [Streptomyces sp. NPDC056503]|uniref:8-oxoguanine DNA glycosylase OGG fold protein n=1 Tax=Streptomyces sp. NPDC056503 TaxID=3345842 RepID=UPI0036AD27E8